jgi:hypothetical protein
LSYQKERVICAFAAPKVKIGYMKKMKLVLTSDVRRSQTRDW